MTTIIQANSSPENCIDTKSWCQCYNEKEIDKIAETITKGNLCEFELEQYKSFADKLSKEPPAWSEPKYIIAATVAGFVTGYLVHRIEKRNDK